LIERNVHYNEADSPQELEDLVEYRQLGRSGLKVSTITLGTMTMGGKGNFAKVGNVGRDEARRQIDVCLDAGVNLIDTANVYSEGASEEIIGEALRGQRKGGVLLATKARFAMGDGPNDSGLSRYHLIRECEASLKRLRTDVIDLYQVHEWDGLTPLEETLEAREAEYELIPISLDQGLGVLVWSPLAGGLLSGKHRRNQDTPERTRQLAGWNEPPIRDENRLWTIVETLVSIAKERGASAAQVALAWLLGRPAVTSVIIGGRTEAHLTDNLGAVDIKLTPEERTSLDQISALPVLYPYWHQVQTANDRLGAADLSLLGSHT
jgi:aryl-alcohol dehydrogenase-like predicted oxidoreductase